jgi:hypothetical protein
MISVEKKATINIKRTQAGPGSEGRPSDEHLRLFSGQNR